MRRMTTALAVCMAILGGAAQATTITISGQAGAGFVTISATGSSQFRGSGTIRDTSAGTFGSDDTIQFFSFLSNSAIQDQLFPLTGDLTLVTQAQSTPITALFLDDDSSTDDADDLGFRAPSALSYMLTPDVRWSLTGSATLALDIANFATGSYPIAAIDTPLSSRSQLQLEVVSAVPVPPALPILAAGLGLLGFVARRRRA